jgi:6-phosphogluconolactonase
MLSLREFATREALMEAAGERIADILINAIDEHGDGCVALSGGSTPAPAYRAFARTQSDWSLITLALVDERFVPPSDPASNQRMPLRRGAKLAPMFSAAENVEQAAARADGLYKTLRIDVALMGMGEDGHTASWFPNARGLDFALDTNTTRSVVAISAPQAQGSAERLTLTRNALKRAHTLVLLITGDTKRARLEQALATQDAPVAALFGADMPPIEVLWAS